jgi:hypothetical protein
MHQYVYFKIKVRQKGGINLFIDLVHYLRVAVICAYHTLNELILEWVLYLINEWLPLEHVLHQ